MIINSINPVKRLNRYCSVLKTYDYFFEIEEYNSDYMQRGVTLLQLEEHLNIPQSIIFNDLKTLMNATNILALGGPDIDCSCDINDKHVEEKIINNELGFSLITTGKSFVSLEFDEREALNAFIKDERKFVEVDGDIIFKEGVSFRHYSELFGDNLSSIISVIDNNQYISFSYKEKGSINFYIDVYPLKILYDSESNMYAIVAWYKGKRKLFRIDYIVDKIKLNYKKNRSRADYTNDEIALMKILPCVWGLQCDDDNKVGRVKVAFKNEGGVWNKVKRDLEYRTYKKLYVDGEYLIYEDDVYGKNAFKRWILGFGSSVIVDRPVKLRKEIIELMNKRIKQLKEFF